ncbi:MAG: hypothetical protein GC155_13280 [Alphaproteobacteria bacterium]|nr:hypothetical protein [Alphaproteobacteria bacterium]
MRIITWNFGRHAPDTPEARTMLDRITAAKPDVVCLTKGYETSLAALGGHVISNAGASWGPAAPEERKVILWSKSPWRDPLDLGALTALGGAVGALTDTDLGLVRFIGIATPNPFASPEGKLPRPPQWSMHISYLEMLGETLKRLDLSTPTVIVGDFNQFVPLIWGAWSAHHALNAALHGFGILTQGDIAPIGEHTLDHVTVTHHLRAGDISGLSRFAEDGAALGDRFGVVVDLESGGVQIFD